MKLLKFISLAWLVRILYIFGLSIVIFVASPHIKISGGLPFMSIRPRVFLLAAIIIIILLGYGLVAWLDYYLNKRFRNKLLKQYNLKQEISKQELAAYHIQTKKLFTALKALKLKNYQGKNIKKLPWLILLGASKSGKTELLNASGLEFPLEALPDGELDKSELLFKDWHLSSDALILKFPSPMAEIHDESPEKNKAVLLAWYSFIEYLKTYNRSQTITGIIITVAINDLLAQELAHVKNIMAGVSLQLKQVMQHINKFCPIHLLITKADLIEGYEEFFNYLEFNQNVPILGVSLPLRATMTSGNLVKTFKTKYNNLLNELNQQVLNVLNTEPNITKRQKIVNLTSLLFSIKEKLSYLLTTILENTTINGVNSVTGVYFCTAQQASNFALNPEFYNNKVAPSNSGLVPWLFKTIILPCAKLVLQKPYYTVPYKVLYGLLATIIVGIVLFIGTGISAHYLLNKQRAEQIDLELRAIEPWFQQKHTKNGIKELLPVLTMLEQNDIEYNEKFKLWQKWFGGYEYYFNPIVTAPILKYALQNVFLAEVSREIKTKLLILNEEDATFYKTVFAYLYLSDPSFHKINSRAKVQKVMEHLWLAQYPEEVATRQQLQKYLGQALASDFLGVRAEPETVNYCRKMLAQQLTSRRIYQELKQDYDRNIIQTINGKLIGLDPVVTKVFNITDNYRIPLLYTAGSYGLLFKGDTPLINEYLQNDAWLKGIAASKEKTQIVIDALMSLYQEDFVSHWSGLLGKLKIKKARNLPALVKNLEFIIENPNCFYAPLTAINENTKIDLISAKKDFTDLVQQSALLTTAKDKEAAPIEQMLIALKQLHAALYTATHAPELKKACWQMAFARFKGALKEDPIANVLLQAQALPAPIESWFIDLALNSWQLIMQEAVAYVNQEWQIKVYEHYATAIANLYPIDKAAIYDVTLEDFTDFFGPEGRVQAFFASYIAPFIDTSGKHWEALTLDGVQFEFLDDTLRSFRVAHAIEHLYFVGQKKQLQVKGKIRARSLDPQAQSVTLSINSQMLAYRHGPLETKEFLWPSGSKKPKANISFVDFKGQQSGITFNGDWGMFKLLEKFYFNNGTSNAPLIINYPGKLQASFTLLGINDSDLFIFRQVRKFKLGARL